MLRITPLLLALFATACWGEDESKTEIDDFSWRDQQHIESQVTLIDDVARRHLGSQFHGDDKDIELLQRLVDKMIVSRNESQTLQAMGAVLGNLFVRTHGLDWMSYEDELGRSRAVCIKGTNHCLFPITMISRRYRVGAKVDVEKIYNESLDSIRPYLPKMPYTD